MRSVTRFRICPVARPARRVLATAIVAALLPAVVLAQGDSARTRKDTTGAIHAAAGKRARLGALGRAAAARANSAANKVEEKTGVSKEAVAQAANYRTKDVDEGLLAARERRAPRFTGD